MPVLGLVALLTACGGGGGGGLAIPARRPEPPLASPLSPTASASPLPAVESANGGWSPYDIANALQFPVQSGYDGRGQTIAVVMNQYPSMNDVDTYLSGFRIPQTGRSITFAPSPDGAPASGGDATEATLDTETVAGLAPGANIIVYGLPAMSQQDFTDTVNYIVANKTASVITFSAGSCEYQGATVDSVLHAAAAAGITVVASAGDQGNNCYNGSGFSVGVDFPASDPHVTGAGGTETTKGVNALTNTTVWNNSCGSGQQCIGGGGLSSFFHTPAFQSGLAGANQSYRNEPDVSMPAVDAAMYHNGWGVINGTSWSAPQYAALIAEVYEYCNGTIANPVTIPYYADSKNPAAFVDVVRGSDQYGGTSPYYSAVPGYDDASGLGVPQGMPLAITVCPGHIAAAGLVTRSAAVQADAVLATPQAYAVNVTPRIRGITDEGRRAPERRTRVQFVLHDSANAAAAEAAVTSSLRSSGFTIVMTFPNHLVVDAQAQSATVERYFSTQLHDVRQDAYGTRYMPVRNALVPQPVARYVSAVNVDDIVTFAPAHR